MVTLVVILVYASLFFNSFAYTSFTPNIESGWQNALASFRHHPSQSYGNDVFYTYGPLSTKIITSVYESDSFSQFVFSLILVSGIFIACLYAILQVFSVARTEKKLVIMGVLITSLFVPASVDMLFSLTLLLSLPYLFSEPNAYKKIFASIGLLALSTYKNNLLLAMLPICLLVGIAWENGSKWIRATFTTTLVCLPLLFLILEGIHINNLSTFLEYVLRNSIAYGEFMNFNQHPLIVVIFYGLFLIYGLASTVKLLAARRINIPAAVLLIGECWLLFIFLKQATTRSDQHLIVFLPLSLYMILSLLLSIKYIFRKNLAKTAVTSLGIASACIISILVGRQLYLVNTSQYLSFIKPQIEFKNIFHYYDYSYFAFKRQLSHEASQGVSAQLRPVLSSLQVYTKKSRTSMQGHPIIGFTNSVFYLPNLAPLHYLYEPSLQNFVAQPTGYFDKASLNYLRSHPSDFIFWDNVVPAIDNRVVSGDLPDTVNYIRNNYHVAARDTLNGFYIFEKNATVHPSVCRTIHTRQTALNSLVRIDHGIDKLKISTGSGPLLLLKDFLYKKPVYIMTLHDSGGRSTQFRAVPNALLDGMYVRPWSSGINEPGEPANYTPDSFSLGASDKRKARLIVHEQVCS